MTNNPLIAEARKKGFKKNVWVQVPGNDLRKITRNILEVKGENNVMTTGPNPFFLMFRGKWVAEVTTK